MYRAELTYLCDRDEILARFQKFGKIHIPLVHGSGSMSYLAVMKLDKNRMLVGRHMHGAMVVEKDQDIALLYHNTTNDLNTVSADAMGLADLLKYLYSNTTNHNVRCPAYIETSMFIGGRKRQVFIARDIFDCFAPYQEWSAFPSVYVAIVGIGSWMTPYSEPLSKYTDEYVAEKTGLSNLTTEEMLVHVQALKAHSRR